MGGYLYDHPRVRLLTWSSPMTNHLLFEAGFGAYQAPFGPYESPGNTTRGARARHRAVRGRMLGQRRHPEPDLSLGELGAQLGRAVHLARLDVVRDRRPQPEDRVRRRGARLGSRESHERSQPRVHRQQRHADLAHAEPVAVHDELSDPQHVVLRSGPVDARTHDAAGRAALRSELELLARAADPADELPGRRRSRFRKRLA